MADFCNQCAGDLGFRNGDFAGLTKPQDWKKGTEWIPKAIACHAIASVMDTVIIKTPARRAGAPA